MWWWNIVVWLGNGPPGGAVTVEAVAEVGDPTILAEFAVIAAVLPMALGARPDGTLHAAIPVGASAAMLFSLLVAFVVSPWAAMRLLGKHLEGAHLLEPGDMRIGGPGSTER